MYITYMKVEETKKGIKKEKRKKKVMVKNVLIVSESVRRGS